MAKFNEKPKQNVEMRHHERNKIAKFKMKNK